MKLSTLFINAANLSRLMGIKVKRVLRYTFLKGVVSVVYVIGNAICSTFVSLKQAQMMAVNFRRQAAKTVRLLSFNDKDTNSNALIQGSNNSNYWTNLSNAENRCSCEDYQNFKDIKNFACKHVYALLNVHGFDSLETYIQSI